jgi:cytochrome c oxidase assembly protein subunit 11
MDGRMNKEIHADNRRLLAKLLVVAGIMFGFGYALVPFYQKICEVTGINNLLNADEPLRSTQVDPARSITVEFDANTHGLPWRFSPGQASVTVHPGELVHVTYLVRNELGRAVTGQAIPSYAPQLAGQHFRKLDCFCFARQTLGPGEAKEMPVVFVIDPALPKEVHTITLSYTFFEVAGTTTAATAQSIKPGA